MAKKLVCYNKSTEKFHQTFGDYYVVGHDIGNNLRIEVLADILIGRLTESTKNTLKEAFALFATEDSERGEFMGTLVNTTDIESFKTNILT